MPVQQCLPYTFELSTCRHQIVRVPASDDVGMLDENAVYSPKCHVWCTIRFRAGFCCLELVRKFFSLYATHHAVVALHGAPFSIMVTLHACTCII